MKEKRILALALAGVMTLSLASCASSGDTSQTVDTTPVGVAVQVQEVTADTISTENKVSGQVTAEDEYMVMVATTAKITAVYVDAGDTVNAGDRLCTLDVGSTLASYNAASISYNSAIQSYNDQSAVFESQIALYEKNVNDLKALFEIGAASQLEIDQAELQLSSAIATRNSTLSQLEAGMQSYKSNVDQLALVLENVDSWGNVIAPASGTITTLNAVESGYTSASSPVAVIDTVDQMKIEVSVSEALVPKLAVGDEVDVTISALDTTFVGTIRNVEKAASAQTKLYNVTVSVPAEVTGLLSGMFADVTFRTDTSVDTLIVPTEAILTSGSTQYVFVVENDAAKYVEVTTGLTAGDQLVTVGQSYLTDGEAVRVVSGED